MRREPGETAVKKLARDEKGQALVLTLLLLLIGSLIITPTLSLMGTGLQSGRVYEQKNDEIYAADAGVEDAMWRIRNDTLDDLLGANYSPYNYSSTYQYPYNLFVNGKNVTVSIQNVWIPTGISTPDAATAQQIIDEEKLIIVGYPDAAASTYDIKIVYYYQGSDVYVKTLGIWLSSGFEYTEYSGSCSLQGQSFYRAPTISLDKGGCAVVWNFTSNPPNLRTAFPGGTNSTTLNIPTVKIFTFKYSGPQGQIPELVASWIDTTGVPGTNPSYSYSWDDSIRLYKIVSRAGGIQIDAYGAKTRFRKLKSAISGNYYGTGNTLIGGNLDPPDNYHHLLYRSTQATVTTNDNDTLGVPSDATIDAAYLYWTGWIYPGDYNPPNSGSQTRYPSGDTIGGSTYRSGTWDKTTSMYSYVDEQGAHDGDSTYLLHGTTAGYMLFGFPAFDVPTNMGITGLTVSLVARDSASGTNNMRPAIRVGGTNYLTTSPSTEVPSSYGTISYTYTTNPRTNRTWRIDDIKGVGSNPLQGFGVYSTDAYPTIRLTQVYATVGWGSTLRYPDYPTQESLSLLVEQTARVNKVYFRGGGSLDTLVTADKWQLLYPPEYDNTNREGSWFYTSKADVTNLLEAWIGNGTISSNGAATYTLSHVAAPNEADPTYLFSFATGGGSTGYPLGTPSPNPPPDERFTTCHAGWSLLILYHCASVYNQQFYLYDIDTPGFTFFTGRNNNVDFDKDGSNGGTVSGFLVPPQSPGETNAARITVFVGEGDKGYTGDYFKVKGTTSALTALKDGVPGYDTYNVWNGNSIGLPPDAGIDIDQFYITWSSGILKPMDVSVLVEVPTGTDRFTMSYMLLQFRSEVGPGGVITNYAIKIAS
jgi:hypothetical protein